MSIFLLSKYVWWLLVIECNEVAMLCAERIGEGYSLYISYSFHVHHFTLQFLIISLVIVTLLIIRHIIILIDTIIL